MNPYDIVGILIAPVPILALLASMALSLAVPCVIAKRAFAQIRMVKIATGYLGVLVSMALVSAAILAANGGLTPGNFIGFVVLFAYMACWMVAVIVLPLVIALTARGRGIVGWVLLAGSVVGAPVFTVSTYLISSRDIGNVTAQQWAYDLLSAAMAMAIISGAFSIGARLPFRRRLQQNHHQPLRQHRRS